MNRKGKQEQNNEAVFSLLSQATKLKDGSYVFTDKSETTYLVNTDGTIYTVCDNMVIPCNNGEKSKKKNGYIYLDLIVDIDGTLSKIEYAQHSVVCALFNGIPFDTNMVSNHKNNCPFDNNPSNLEWTTQYYNKLHGRIVRCATDVHNSEKKLVWTGYDLYIQKSNLKHSFDCLKVGISCEDIRNYENHVGKCLNKYWDMDEDTKLMSLYYYDEFIKWWAKRNNINLKNYKEV